jgi:peptide deformylase
MAIRPILKYPDPRLRQVCKPVSDPSALRALVEDMAETMYAAKGAGLAAIQVGEALRLFIIESSVAGGGEEDPPLVFVNPELVELSREKETAEEGCLSFPGIYVPVERSLRATIRAMNLEGRTFELDGEELFARAMQHESDHLDGKLLADFVGRIKRQLIARRLARSAAEEAGKESGG